MGLHRDTAQFLLQPRDIDISGSLEIVSHANARVRHFLIISAPFGPFSRKLGRHLRQLGARCTRVLLNGGDVFDWGPSNARPYFGPRSRWIRWLRETALRDGVTDVILYGDSNPYCADAKRIAHELLIKVHVLEQGYFRPFWVTLERDGVNGTSRLPREPDAYREAASSAEPIPEAWLAPLTPWAVYRISAYHVSLYLTSLFFPMYRQPYTQSALKQMVGHIRRYLSQKLFKVQHARRLNTALDTSGPLFLSLLQRPGDSQLLRHSPFADAASFITHVVASFASHAPENARLLFKSHPLDPGLEPHDRTVAKAAEVWGVADRVFFTDVGDLDKMVPKSTGVVTINSTAGLAALARRSPTAVLGSAIYDMPGLTHQGGLDRFWTCPEAPNMDLYQAFRRVVMARTQINGAFASREGIELAFPEIARRLLAE